VRRRAAVLALLSAIAAPASAQDAVEGVIESVDTAQMVLVLRTASGTRSGRFTAQTMVVSGGMPGEVRDLRPGQSVRVTFATSSGGAARAEIVRIVLR
jgi:hypothetical protein